MIFLLKFYLRIYKKKFGNGSKFQKNTAILHIFSIFRKIKELILDFCFMKTKFLMEISKFLKQKFQCDYIIFLEIEKICEIAVFIYFQKSIH